MLAEMTAAHRAPVHIWRRTDGRPGKLWQRECFLNGGGGEAAQKQRRCCVCLGVKGTFTDCTYVWGLRLSQGLWYDSGSLWILEGTWVRKRMNTAQHITTQHYTTTLDKRMGHDHFKNRKYSLLFINVSCPAGCTSAVTSSFHLFDGLYIYFNRSRAEIVPVLIFQLTNCSLMTLRALKKPCHTPTPNQSPTHTSLELPAVVLKRA